MSPLEATEHCIMDIPSTRKIAEEHISQIRKSKCLDGPDTNRFDLEAALIILSEQLYQKSTHFLLELVQNADDNTYQVQEPTLNLTYSRGTLRLDCNEIGFGKRNVEAICRIGRSTKAGKDSSRKSIGEKGIGFKSVFKVSDVVWITSGHYSFKFDKKETLGMIAPIWEKFHLPLLPGYTSFLFQLSPEYDPNHLIDEIKSLDPKILLFLRKLRQVNLISLDQDGNLWKGTLRRQEASFGLDGDNVVKLWQNEESSTLKITTTQVIGFPPEPKRPGCMHSEIILAFPIADTGNPCIGPQNVYAFLPIRDYGFKFLIQADFLLTASREEIDASSRWNQKLLDAISQAFVEAVEECNKGVLRYTWMRYLPNRGPLSDFFGGLESSILELLAGAPVVEDFVGNLKQPSELRIVPAEFAEENGEPLISNGPTMSSYVSRNYSTEDFSDLNRIRVKNLSALEFLEHLKLSILDNKKIFQEKPRAWHSRLASILLRMTHEYRTIKTALSELEIVLLRDGRWVSPSVENVCFPNRSDLIRVPGGLNIHEIHPVVASDPFQRSLIFLLGAKSFDKDMVCDTIVGMHEDPEFNPGDASVNDLIAHIVFLYHANWKNIGKHDLWFVTESGSVRHGSELYVDLDESEPYSATAFFKENRKKFPFLRHSYRESLLAEHSNWTSWLVANLHLAAYPRLVAHGAYQDQTMSKDFHFLLEASLQNEILLLFRENWLFYAKWILKRNNSTEETNILKTLASMQVPCRGAGDAPLNETTLNGPGLLLDIPEPEDPRWKYLACFGVIVEISPRPFIQRLRQLKQCRASLEEVSELYVQIQNQASSHGEMIRSAFRAENLVYVPDTEPGNLQKWAPVSICVWDGPKCLRKSPCLKLFYSEHPLLLRFFCNTLEISNASWETLLKEAQLIDVSDSIKYISEVFFALSARLQVDEDTKNPNKDIITMLAVARIFPIETRISGDSVTSFHHLSTIQQDEIWFIADRFHLRQNFEGLVPLLALGFEHIEKIRPLIKKLNIEHRLLSNIARASPKPQGPIRLCSDYTSLFRAKARFIARMLPETLNRKLAMEQLQNIEVYSARKVIVEWSLKPEKSHRIVTGRSDSGRVQVISERNVLKLILRKNDIDASRPPLELQEEIVKFCGITDPAHVTILHWMLVEHDLKEIEDVLQRRGISNNIPEFDTLIQDSRNGGTFDAHWRRYVGRNEENGSSLNGQEYSDAVSSFIAHFNLVSGFQKRLTQSWESAEPETILSHICRLEKMDPFSLLPQHKDGWNQKIRRAGGHPDDFVGIMFRHGQNATHRSSASGDQTFSASVAVSAKGNIRVQVSTGGRVMIDDETLFAGELYVSKILEKHMGDAYSPAVHWTSSLRGKAGFEPYTNNNLAQSTFTIEDRSGSFTKLLSRNGYKLANSWLLSPTYHIEVNTSEEGAFSAFSLSPHQVNKAWKYNVQMRTNHDPSDVFVLIRISNVRTKPELTILVDPWRLHMEGLLSLTTQSDYLVDFTELPPSISIDMTKMDRPRKQATESRFGKMLGKSRKVSQSNQLELDQIYSYKPLSFGEVRLLELSAGTGDTPIRGVLRLTPLESAGRYFALSYVWGPALTSFNIETPEGKIPLTGTLHAALKRLRDKDIPIILWADAICINQADDHEKIVQIRLMGKIYRNAEKVFAWNGTERDNSNCAIETLVQIRTLAVKPDEWPKNLPPKPSTWTENSPPPEDTIWADIGKFFERDLFQRIWVVQELVLATDVRILCGDWNMSFDDIVAALEVCRESFSIMQHSKPQSQKFDSQAKPAYALALTRRMFNDPRLSQRFNLLSLLDMFAYTDATLERDKLFALLGLASDAENEIFDPDYSSPLEVIIRRYANEFVRRGNTIDLLYRAGTSKAYEFCSWIPKWTGREPCRTISTWPGAKGIFSAGGLSRTKAKLDKKHRLEVTGAPVDVVAELLPTTTNEQDIISVVNVIHELINRINNYPTGETREELKLKIPIGNAMTPCADDAGTLEMSIIPANDANQTFNWAEVYTAISSVQDMVDFLKTPRGTREKSWKYWTTAAAFAKRLSNGRFCTTRKGYIGFVPYDAKLGDEICVVHGAVVPFVLRKLTESGKAYKLIGESYIHGIMYGEALLSVEIQEKHFILV